MLSTKIGKLKLNNVIMNASGVNCTTEKDLLELNSSTSGCIITKSTTLEKRLGNICPRYYDTKYLSINSSGLPNLGYKFYINNSENIQNYNINKNRSIKPYVISVSGLTIDDNKKIINDIIEFNYNRNSIHGIELNLSCPNIIGKPQIGYDFDTMNHLLDCISNIIPKESEINFGIKLPPYFDISHFDQVSNIINKYNVDSITCINSLGNGLVVDPFNERTVIVPKNGFGGIGGSIVKPIALSNVRQFYEKTNCDIIGCGGISNGLDAFEHILCGASGVQIGTQLYRESVNCFERICDELIEIMNSKSYSNINEFKGNLKHVKHN